MTDMAIVPGWVKVPHREVADCLRIAHVVAMDGGPVRVAAIAATLNWVTQGQESPLTERPIGPVSEKEARAEWYVAGGPPPREVWVELGVEPLGAVTGHRGWCRGVGETLGWLLGIHSRPPIPLPRRNPDGSTPTGDQLYREAVEANPYSAWEPEQRRDARNQADLEAARYLRLAELASSAV